MSEPMTNEELIFRLSTLADFMKTTAWSSTIEEDLRAAVARLGSADRLMGNHIGDAIWARWRSGHADAPTTTGEPSDG